MKPSANNFSKFLLILFALFTFHLASFSRGGGGGGHSSHSSSSSHSSGGSGFGGGSISVGGGGGGSFFFIIIIVVVIILISKKKSTQNSDNKRSVVGGNNGSSGDIVDSILGTIGTLLDSDNDDNGRIVTPLGTKNFPEGLTSQKVSRAFMDIQSAWQSQDLSKVRKWISDGVYQRFMVQFEMMQKLTQHNRLNNIRIYDISVANVYSDRAYECVDVAITFSMDDHFICDKYPSLNQSFYGDEDAEYWTFIKRKDSNAASTTDLYNSDNCPNCGASLDNKLGEVSRCPNCKTLVNNASYDWVLSEITQDQDYQKRNNELLISPELMQLVQNDPLFAVQRMEDIASNVFMQIMEVLSSGNENKLERFAAGNVAQQILEIRSKNGSFVFDRIYLNDVTLYNFNKDNNNLNLTFKLGASYKRVRIQDGKAIWLDGDFIDGNFSLTLSKSLEALQTKPKEIAYSYECGSCGAPFDDTTKDTCSYCGAPVVDVQHNWVLTDFTA